MIIVLRRAATLLRGHGRHGHRRCALDARIDRRELPVVAAEGPKLGVGELAFVVRGAATRPAPLRALVALRRIDELVDDVILLPLLREVGRAGRRLDLLGRSDPSGPLSANRAGARTPIAPKGSAGKTPPRAPFASLSKNDHEEGPERDQAAFRLTAPSASLLSSLSVFFSSSSVCSRRRAASFMPSCVAQLLREP